MLRDVDVAVVGAGPVGCIAALAHARRGAKVALLEAHPTGKPRLAGELLHSPAAAILRDLGVMPLGTHPVRGFAVFSKDRDTAVLNDQGPDFGVTLEFNRLVANLRAAAADMDGITYLQGWRGVQLEGQELTVDVQGQQRTLTAGRIVGAGGRSSVIRRSLGLPSDKEVLSRMAGLVLRGVDLPWEGRGHVVIGPVGPALIYRIGG